MSLVSVIIPYYRKKQYISRALKSVTNQTYKKLEIIIIYDDNNKSDLKFIKYISSKDKRIKIYVNKKNLGAGLSRNVGIKKSKGKYIAFLDADDLWYRNKTDHQIKYMKIYAIRHSLTQLNEEKKIQLCNSGIMIIKTKHLFKKIKKIKNKNKKKEFYLTDLVEIFIKENYKVSNFNCKLGESMGVNDKEDLAKLEKQFQEEMRKKFLKKGVTLIDPSSVYFSKDTKIGKDVVIYPNVYFGPGVKVGDKTTIKSFCHIELTKIGSSGRIKCISANALPLSDP